MKRIRWNKALCILLCATLVCSEGVTGQAAVSKKLTMYSVNESICQGISGHRRTIC